MNTRPDDNPQELHEFVVTVRCATPLPRIRLIERIVGASRQFRFDMQDCRFVGFDLIDRIVDFGVRLPRQSAGVGKFIQKRARTRFLLVKTTDLRGK